LEAIYPKPRLSVPGGSEHRIYPYLLRGLRIERPNQVWSADITYIRLSRGFVYLMVHIEGIQVQFDYILHLRVEIRIRAVEPIMPAVRLNLFGGAEDGRRWRIPNRQCKKALRWTMLPLALVKRLWDHLAIAKYTEKAL
ncbi:MAG: hypothetical protein JSW47_20255, partial [Phycisphaerales bacterium]